MPHSLDDAIRENNEWEKQRKELDKRWAEQVVGSADPIPPAPSFEERLAAFNATHVQSIRNYIGHLAKTSSDSGNQEFISYRASHLKLMLDALADNPKKFFADEHDISLRKALLEGTNSSMSAYVSDYAARLREAANDLEKLNGLYKADHGPML